MCDNFVDVEYDMQLAAHVYFCFVCNLFVYFAACN